MVRSYRAGRPGLRLPEPGQFRVSDAGVYLALSVWDIIDPKGGSKNMKCVLCILAMLVLAGFSVRAADNPEDKFVSSTWANGNGPGTQIWVLHVVGNTFTGAVCGPCDDPQSLAPIVDGRVIDAHHIKP